MTTPQIGISRLPTKPYRSEPTQKTTAERQLPLHSFLLGNIWQGSRFAIAKNKKPQYALADSGFNTTMRT
jgi:hypothetical protein